MQGECEGRGVARSAKLTFGYSSDQLEEEISHSIVELQRYRLSRAPPQSSYGLARELPDAKPGRCFDSSRSSTGAELLNATGDP